MGGGMLIDSLAEVKRANSAVMANSSFNCFYWSSYREHYREVPACAKGLFLCLLLSLSPPPPPLPFSLLLLLSPSPDGVLFEVYL